MSDTSSPSLPDWGEDSEGQIVVTLAYHCIDYTRLEDGSQVHARLCVHCYHKAVTQKLDGVVDLRDPQLIGYAPVFEKTTVHVRHLNRLHCAFCTTELFIEESCAPNESPVENYSDDSDCDQL